jgi:hypothetical protein
MHVSSIHAYVCKIPKCVYIHAQLLNVFTIFMCVHMHAQFKNASTFPKCMHTHAQFLNAFIVFVQGWWVGI